MDQDRSNGTVLLPQLFVQRGRVLRFGQSVEPGIVHTVCWAAGRWHEALAGQGRVAGHKASGSKVPRRHEGRPGRS